MSDKLLDPAVKLILDNVLKEADIAWWEWNIVENRVISNELKTTMLGYKLENFRDEDYQAYTKLLHPDDYERTMQAMRDHLDGSASLYQVDYRIRRADGTYTWYMDRGSIVERDTEGKPLTLRGIVADLGETLREKSHDEAMLRLIRRKLPSTGSVERTAILCCSCKKIKISESTWVSINDTFERIFFEKISHGICVECRQSLYPEMENYGDL